MAADERFRSPKLAAPMQDFTEPVIIHVDFRTTASSALTMAEHMSFVSRVHGNWTTPA